VVGSEQWPETRRLHLVKGLSQRETRLRTSLHRDTIRKAISGNVPPDYRRAPVGSKLDPFKGPRTTGCARTRSCPGVRIRELHKLLGSTASKTIVDDYLREVRPLFHPGRARPWHPSRAAPAVQDTPPVPPRGLRT
jgi:hypothetical protein